jgi:hypothetical protein
MYVITSGTWAALILGGIGVDVNALFDFVIGLSITAALTLETLTERTTTGSLAVQICLMAGLSYAVLKSTPIAVERTRVYLVRLPSFIANSKADIQYLAGVPGPAICEDLALCYWAGKAFEVDLSWTGQKLLLGSISEQKFIEVIEGKRYAVIQTTTFQLPESVVKAIFANYEVDQESDVNGFFLRPRPQGEVRE